MTNNQNIDFKGDFFDLAHSPCAIFNRNLILLDINYKALQVLNIQKERVIGKKLIDIFPFIESKEPYKAYWEVMETGNPIDDSVKLTLRAKEYYFLCKAFKVGEGLGFSGIDITENVSAVNEWRYLQSQFETVNTNLKYRKGELETLKI